MNTRGPQLAHSMVGAGNATTDRLLFFLHGLLGRGSNWHGFAQQLVAARPEWTAVLVDLRMHGGSQGFAPPHTLAAASADVTALIESLAPSRCAVVGPILG